MNPLSMLNGFCQALRLDKPKMKIDMGGPPHAPVFSGTLTWFDTSVIADARTSKETEAQLARKVLARMPFVEVPDHCIVNVELGFQGNFTLLGYEVKTPVLTKRDEVKRCLLAMIFIRVFAVPQEQLYRVMGPFQEALAYVPAVDRVARLHDEVSVKISHWQQRNLSELRLSLEPLVNIKTPKFDELLTLAFIRPASYAALISGDPNGAILIKEAVKDVLHSDWSDNTVLAFYGDRVINVFALMDVKSSNPLTVHEAQTVFTLSVREDRLVKIMRNHDLTKFIQLNSPSARDEGECLEALIGVAFVTSGVVAAYNLFAALHARR